MRTTSLLVDYDGMRLVSTYNFAFAFLRFSWSGELIDCSHPSTDLGTQLSNIRRATNKCSRSASCKERTGTRRSNFTGRNRSSFRSQSDSNFQGVLRWADTVPESWLCFAQRNSSHAIQTKRKFLCATKGISKEAKNTTGRTCASTESTRYCLSLIGMAWLFEMLCKIAFISVL